MDTPKNLCRLCAAIDIVELGNPDRRNPWYNHHGSIAALESTASSGCPLCALFLWSTLNHCSDVESRIFSPERYLSSEQCVHYYGVTTGFALRNRYETHLGRGPGWEASKVLEYHRCMDANDAPGFKVLLSTVTLAQEVPGQAAARSTAWNGLRYIRIDVDDAEAVAVNTIEGYPYLPSFVDKSGRQIAPWVSMSALSGDTGNVLGRTPSPTLDVNLCRRWLLECTTSHRSCRSSRGNALPTRVLEVMGALPEMVRLVESPGASDQYSALSYCWGSSRPLSTTADTYHSHLTGIPVSDLPRLYQDAVAVCRMLEIRYLWIDSLCIIQDDQADWQRECARMDRIYEQALLSINVPGATDPTCPFLRPRPRTPGACTLDVAWASQQSRGRVEMAAVGSAQLAFAREELGGPLEKRAWVTQEYLLSPRTLSFGSVQMYFTCNEGIRFENMAHQTSQVEYIDVMGPQLEPRLTKNMLASSGQDRYTLWYTLVSQYSGKSLTHASDRLPALSGLARRFAKDFAGDTYVAGLWRNDLRNGLLWRADYWRRGVNSACMDPQASRSVSPAPVPSWSWISCDQRVSFEKQHDAVGDGNRKWVSRVRDVRTRPVGFDAFGEVGAGELSLEGPLTVKEKGFDPLGRPTAPEADAARGDDREMVRLFLSVDYVSSYVPMVFGLLLERVDGSDSVFRRVGLYRDLSRKEDPWDLIHAMERRTVLIL